MRDQNIVLGLSDFRKLFGVVNAMKSKRRALEPHMLRLESELALATVVDGDAAPADVVALGSTVRILDLDSREERVVTVVFPAGLDGGEDKVSIFAPLGTALIGERKGATVSCIAPGGVYWFNVLEVEPARRE